MMMSFFVRAVLTLVSAAAGSQIVGGAEVMPPFKYGFMASLLKYGDHFCGGTHLASGTIVTAAHCTYDKDKYFEILLHRHDFNKAEADEGALRFPVKSRLVHPNFVAETYQNDIAIWRFDGGPNPPKVLLDDGSLSNSVGTKLTVAGWGYTKPGGEKSHRLMETHVPVYNPSQCVADQLKRKDKVFLDVQFCAGFPEGGHDACQSDSGGPIFSLQGHVPVLVGVVSWGNECAEKHLPGVYTKVSAFLPWLKSQISF
ncbi:hypothetical protein DSO57_1015708 [Entomophthora muscae]|uniref:Uncharacterized protein n=1 Tax=Entomophthora muscae TaxID=34485 RepID=A0ACC2RW47_9FUNG|nr:hypothetical protein DSO57_1015708 [Entomophthora muscae]